MKIIGAYLDVCNGFGSLIEIHMMMDAMMITEKVPTVRGWGSVFRMSVDLLKRQVN